jgi:hypothetical protein
MSTIMNMVMVQNSELISDKWNIIRTCINGNYAQEPIKLTPWSKVLLGKLIVTHLVKKFPTFHGT